jgi:hypothetical protein
MNLYRLFLIFVCIFIINISLHADWIIDPGPRVTLGQGSVFKTDICTVNGLLIVDAVKQFHVQQLSGAGTIQCIQKGNKPVVLQIDQFNFTGTIECNGQCIIRSKKPFDYRSFTKKGTGTFKIIISPHDFIPLTGLELILKVQKECVYYALNKSDLESSLSQYITLPQYITFIRYLAAANILDEKSIFFLIDNFFGHEIIALEEGYEDMKPLLQKRYDTRHLGGVLGCATMLPLGLGCAYQFFKDTEKDPYTMLTLGAIISALSVAGVCYYLYQCCNPKYKEEVDRVLVAKERLEYIKKLIADVLMQPYIVEEQIIELS